MDATVATATATSTPSVSDLKYRLTDETIEHEGLTLFRIEAVRSFGDVDAGERGGFVQSDANLCHRGACWIYEDAKVFGYASVSQNARVCDEAQVFGNAKIEYDAVVNGTAKVFGFARILDRAVVSDDARVYDSATVEDDARVFGRAQVGGNAFVSHHAKVCGNAVIMDHARVCDQAVVRQNATIGLDTRLHGGALVTDSADIRIYGCVTDSEVRGRTRMSGGAEAHGAKLRDVTVTVPVIVVNGLPYPVTISDSVVRIGCQQFDFDHWRKYGRDIMMAYITPKDAKRMMKALKPLMKHQEKCVRKAAKSG